MRQMKQCNLITMCWEAIKFTDNREQIDSRQDSFRANACWCSTQYPEISKTTLFWSKTTYCTQLVISALRFRGANNKINVDYEFHSTCNVYKVYCIQCIYLQSKPCQLQNKAPGKQGSKPRNLMIWYSWAQNVLASSIWLIRSSNLSYLFMVE